MNRIIILTASALGFIGVILGAFGAHALENSLTSDQLSTYDTGVRYQLIHSILLLFLGLENRLNKKRKKIIWLFLLIGILFFSGSIYGLATNELTLFDFKKIALVTPLGGALLIFAWLLIFISYWSKTNKTTKNQT
jgi:uncharacterized membrane protein YgdD (TMEM256/DUF423 family)